MSNTIVVIRDEDLESDELGNLVLPRKIHRDFTFGYFETGISFPEFFCQNIERHVHDLSRKDSANPASGGIVGSLQEEAKRAKIEIVAVVGTLTFWAAVLSIWSPVKNSDLYSSVFSFQ